MSSCPHAEWNEQEHPSGNQTETLSRYLAILQMVLGDDDAEFLVGLFQNAKDAPQVTRCDLFSYKNVT